MIGVPNKEPNTPPLDMVNVPKNETKKVDTDNEQYRYVIAIDHIKVPYHSQVITNIIPALASEPTSSHVFKRQGAILRLLPVHGNALLDLLRNDKEERLHDR